MDAYVYAFHLQKIFIFCPDLQISFISFHAQFFFRFLFCIMVSNYVFVRPSVSSFLRLFVTTDSGCMCVRLCVCIVRVRIHFLLFVARSTHYCIIYILIMEMMCSVQSVYSTHIRAHKHTV